MTNSPPTIPRHPAPWNALALVTIGEQIAAERLRVGRPLRVLDPFAGVGRLFPMLDDPEVVGVKVGVELEPEWAAGHPSVRVGSALDLPAVVGDVAPFDVIVTSPCYGNRMADHHEAKDPCRECGGEGAVERLATPEEVDAGCELGIAYDRCRACNGFGLSRRNTYRHALGRPLTTGSAAGLQWGPAYRSLHRRAWSSCLDVAAPGALVLVNLKNHYRGGEEQPVVEWHLAAWLSLGALVRAVLPVPARGIRQGANAGVRTESEVLLVLRAPLARRDADLFDVEPPRAVEVVRTGGYL